MARQAAGGSMMVRGSGAAGCGVCSRGAAALRGVSLASCGRVSAIKVESLAMRGRFVRAEASEHAENEADIDVKQGDKAERYAEHAAEQGGRELQGAKVRVANREALEADAQAGDQVGGH